MPDDTDETIEEIVEENNGEETKGTTEKDEQYEIIVTELARLGNNITELSGRISQLEQSDRIVHESIGQSGAGNETEPKQHWYFRKAWSR